MIRAWIEYSTERRVFPLLQELSVEWISEIGSALVIELAGSSLQAIRLKTDGSDEAVAPEIDSMMQGLASVSPRIQRLTLSRDPNSLPLGGLMLAAIHQWTHLRDVHLDGIPATDELLNALSSLAYLRELRLRPYLEGSSITRYQFASLRHVELARCNLASATRFLSALDSLRLRSVELSPHSRSDQSRDRLIETVRVLSKNTYLEEVRITQSGRTLGTAYYPASEKTLDLVFPLLSLTHIRCLSLLLSQAWGAGDEAVVAIAHAWPELEMLGFSGLNRMFISFHTFAVLLNNCPNLRILGIPINILSPLPSIDSLRNPPNRTLCSLRFTAPHLLNEALELDPVAEFLHAACPSVQCNAVGGLHGRRKVSVNEMVRLQTLMDSFKTEHMVR